MPSEFRRLALLGLAATAAAERCNVDAVVVHCEARCAGVNATSFSASNPAGTMLQPPAAGRNLFLAQLESSDERPTPLGGAPMIFTQLQEGAAAKPPASQGGSPSAISAVDAATFTEGTVYAPVHEPLSPDQLIGAIGPADKIEWQSAASGTLRCVDGRYATAGELRARRRLRRVPPRAHRVRAHAPEAAEPGARAQFVGAQFFGAQFFGHAQLGRAIRRAGAALTPHAAPPSRDRRRRRASSSARTSASSRPRPSRTAPTTTPSAASPTPSAPAASSICAARLWSTRRP